MTTNKRSEKPTTTILAADGVTLVPVPPEFVCPLTLDVMQAPLLSREGHNYERHAILQWVAQHGTSPLTRQVLQPSHLVTNKALQTKIQLFLKQHNVVHHQGKANDEGTADQDELSSHDFVGYVVSPAATTTSKQQPSSTVSSDAVSLTMSLHNLAASTLQAQGQAQLQQDENESQAVPSQDHLAERRQQIADLILGAMRNLDNF